jgi:hypothetical protein
MFLDLSTTTVASTSFPSPWTLSWPWTDELAAELDEQQLEALIGTVIDTIVAAARSPLGRPPLGGLRKVLGDFAKPLESESPGFVYITEGIGVTPTVWTGDTTYRPVNISTSSTYWSSSREGTFSINNYDEV